MSTKDGTVDVTIHQPWDMSNNRLSYDVTADRLPGGSVTLDIGRNVTMHFEDWAALRRFARQIHGAVDAANTPTESLT